MTQAERDRLVARIVAGVVPVRVYLRGRERHYQVAWPTPLQVLEAESVFEETFRSAELENLFSDDDLLDWLYANELWDTTRESQRTGLPRDIENLKVGVYEYRDKQVERERARAALKSAQAKLIELECELHAYDALSCAGVARQARLKHRVACGLQRNGKRVYGDGFAADNSDLIQEAVSAWHAAQLTEAQFRELARNAPWHGLWCCRDTAASLFGIPACRYTDEQQQLVAVAQLYDNIRQHPDAPAEYVYDDDDMLDGWLILERRKSGRDSEAKDLTGGMHPKIASSQEVFKIVGSAEEARRVYELNSPQARKTIQDRMRAASTKTVAEANLPDQKRNIMMQLSQMEKARNGGG